MHTNSSTPPTRAVIEAQLAAIADAASPASLEAIQVALEAACERATSGSERRGLREEAEKRLREARSAQAGRLVTLLADSGTQALVADPVELERLASERFGRELTEITWSFLHLPTPVTLTTPCGRFERLESREGVREEHPFDPAVSWRDMFTPYAPAEYELVLAAEIPSPDAAAPEAARKDTLPMISISALARAGDPLLLSLALDCVEASLEAALAGSGNECPQGTVLNEILALDTPSARRGRSALTETLRLIEAHEAAERAQARLHAQRTLDSLGLGAIRRVDLTVLQQLSVRELLQASRAVACAYPAASLRGGFYYLTGEDARFDEVWSQLHELHPEVLARLERWGTNSSRGEGSSKLYAPEVSDEVLAIVLEDGIRGFARLGLQVETDAASRTAAFSLSDAGHLAELEELRSSDLVADAALVENTTAGPDERIEAAVRIAGSVLAAVQQAAELEGVESATLEPTFLRAFQSMPPALRICMLRLSTEYQPVFRRILSQAVALKTQA